MKDKVNYKKIIFYSVFIFLIILGRIIFLDADLKPGTWTIELFSLDEGFYTQSAFNLYNYGTFTHNVVPYITGDAGVANLFQTILTYISLLIFGNNYYGVRMPSVFISLVTIWLFYLTLQNIREDDTKFTNYSIFFIVLYFVTDFEYLSISRIYVPTVFRIFFITLMIYIFSRYYKKGYKETFTYKNIFLFSFLSMSSIFFIYIYNIFIYSATIFTIFIVSVINNWKNNKKQIFKDSLFSILGSLIALILFLTYLKIIYNFTLFEYLHQILGNEHSKHLLESSNIFYLIITTLKFDISTNIFRFNLSLLFLFLIFFPIFTYKIIIRGKAKNIFYFYSFNLLIFMYFQTIFENTYYHRRLTIMLPIIIVIINYAYNYNKEIALKLLKHKIFSLYNFLVFPLIIYTNYHQNINNRIFGALNTKIKNGYNGNLTIDFIIINLLVFLIIFLFISLYKLKNRRILILLILIPNLYLNLRYIYCEPTFYSKYLMKSISEKVDNKITFGQYAFSYRFYNNSIPVLNFYNYFPDKKQEYSIKMSFLLQREKELKIIQNAYDENWHIKNINSQYIKLELIDLYYSGRGIFISFLNVKNKRYYNARY